MPLIQQILHAQDGTIEYQIKLTGELSTNPLSPDEDPANPKYGTLVAPGVNAQAHQHLFCARLDFSVDDPHGGKALTVSEACPVTCAFHICTSPPQFFVATTVVCCLSRTAVTVSTS